MPVRDIIVVGASFGGVRALRQLFRDLPADLPAAIFVVCHMHVDAPDVLARILNESAALPVAFAEDRESIRPGRIYVAPPDHHLLLTAKGVRVSRGPRENRFRPAIDPLFRSAATHFGRRVIGIVLTGLLDDGTQGMWFIRRRGGVCIAQDPREAEAPDMPQSAIDEGVVDHVVAISEMPALLSRLVSEPVLEQESQSGDDAMSSNDDQDIEHLHPKDVTGPQVPLACPDCRGALWLEGGGGDSQPPRYECHVGHQFTEQGLMVAKREELEAAMWTALRVLKENAALLGTMAERARAAGRNTTAEHFEQTRRDYHEKGQLIRRAIEGTTS